MPRDEDHLPTDLWFEESGERPVSEEDLTEEELRLVMNAINSDLRGATLEEVRRLSQDEGPEGWYERSARHAFVVLGGLLDQALQGRAHFEGLLNLTNDLQRMIPAHAMERFAQLSRAAQDDVAFANALRVSRGNRDGLVVGIGDLDLPGFRDFSVVSCSFEPHGGILGVIAPVWMNYGKAMSTTSYMANRLETLLVTSCSRPTDKQTDTRDR